MLHRVAKALPLWGWATLVFLVVVGQQYLVAAWQLPLPAGKTFGSDDPDTWLRLSLVRDWLQTGQWYNHQYHSNTPFTLPTSPWTRPLDLVIAALVKLQPGTPINIALMRAASVMPFMWLLLLVVAQVKSLRLIAPRTHAPVMMLLAFMLTSPMMFNYFGVGNADHHALLTALWGWAMYHTLAYDETGWKSPAWLGAIVALMLWISPESLLLLTVLYGWFGLRWMTGFAPARILARLASIVAIFSLVALLVERSPAQLALPLHDTLSLVHVVALALAALGAWALAACPATTLSARALCALLVLVVCTLAIYAIDPRFLHGPMADVVPFITETFLKNIHEAQSITSKPALAIIGQLIQPVVALLVALRCARHSDSILPARAGALLALLVASCTLFYMQQQRWAYYLYPTMQLPLAAWLGAWMVPENPVIARYWPAQRLSFMAEKSVLMRRIPLLALLLAAPLLILVLTQETSSPAEKAIQSCGRDLRRVVQSGELNQLANGRPLNLLATTNIGGELLFFTHHHIVASNYHREGNSIREVWNSFTTTSAKEYTALLRKRRIQAILLCRDSDAPDNAISSRLYDGTYTPVWAQRVALTTPKLRKYPPVLLLVKGTP